MVPADPRADARAARSRRGGRAPGLLSQAPARSGDLMIDDLRSTLRLLRRNRALAGVAIATLALGIAANTIVVALLKSVVLNPLPGVAGADRIVSVLGVGQSGQPFALSYPDYRDLRDDADLLSGLAGHAVVPFNLTIDGAAERVWGELVTGDFFAVFGVGARLGRTLLPSDDEVPRGHPVAVISDDFWRRRFGGDPHVVGRTIAVGRRPYTIVGVVAPPFRGAVVGLSLHVFVPVMMQPEILPFGDALELRDSHWLIADGRLKPGVTLEQAAASMAAAAGRLARAYPYDFVRERAVLRPLWRSPVGAQAMLVPFLGVLMGGAALVLLVACANLASVLLARGVNREREFAIRRAIGSGRVRLVRMVLVENVVLALVAGAAALLLTMWANERFTGANLGMPYPVALANDVDLVVLGWALAVAVVSGVGIGLLPALAAGRVEPWRTLHGGASVARVRRSPLRAGLLVVQVAVALALLVTSLVAIESARRTRAVDPGFDATNLALASMNVAANGYDAGGAHAFYERLLDRVAALPGVRSAACATALPLGIYETSSLLVEAEGYAAARGEDMVVLYSGVSPGYFDTMGIPVRRGRAFTPVDDAGGAPVAIVNETFARRYWPGVDPVARRFRAGESWRRVVGVVPDVKYLTMTERARPFMYFPLGQTPPGEVTLHARTELAPDLLGPGLEAIVREIDPELPLFGVRTMERHVAASLAGFSLAAEVLGAAGLLALLLAAVGLYGVMANNVRQRTHEIGVRVALGASPGDVLRLIAGQALGLTLAGPARGPLRRRPACCWRWPPRPR